MKSCHGCQKILELTDFYKSTVNKDGYRNKCKKCLLIKQKEDYKSNPERFKIASKKWTDKNNTEEKKIQKRLYIQKRLKEDIHFKLAHNLRSRLYNAIKRNQKIGSAIDDLGCSILELKIYIESKFTEGMTWDNYGEWELDHIIALSTVDLTNKEQFLKVNNYSNLQPLWKSQNRQKYNNSNN